jgi:hypothetical protein
MVPTVGAAGTEFTFNVNVATAAAHGVPRGLFVVTVIITFLPASVALGVYVNEKGDVLAEAGVIVPSPFSVIVTLVALPPNVFPLIVTGDMPQVFPVMVLSDTVGPLTHPHDTVKTLPVVVHPAAFLTVIVWLPLGTLVNVVTD